MTLTNAFLAVQSASERAQRPTCADESCGGALQAPHREYYPTVLCLVNTETVGHTELNAEALYCRSFVIDWSALQSLSEQYLIQWRPDLALTSTYNSFVSLCTPPLWHNYPSRLTTRSVGDSPSSQARLVGVYSSQILTFSHPTNKHADSVQHALAISTHKASISL